MASDFRRQPFHILLLTVSLIGAAAQSANYVIDLVPRSEQTSAARSAVPGELLSNRPKENTYTTHESKRPIQAFELTLLDLDRTSYAMGEPVTFDLLLKHRGPVPIAFPASDEGERFGATMKNARIASISLTLNDPVLSEQFIGLTLLYGADDVPGSLILLKPGETIQIRARSVWSHSKEPPKRLEPDWVRETEVGAQVIFDFIPDIEQIVRSTNRVAVYLRATR
jgi:hypothetical protein